MTITQAEIDDLRRKADEALEVEEEWGPPIRDNSDEIVKTSLRMSGDIHALLTRAVLGETEEG